MILSSYLCIFIQGFCINSTYIISGEYMKQFKLLETESDSQDISAPLADDYLSNHLNGLLSSAELDSLKSDDEASNKAGLLRSVKNAHMVYKRKTQEGTFEELWIYNCDYDEFQESSKIKQAILSGTDIIPGERSSEDESQKYELIRLGNAMLLHITGLPN